MHFTLNGGRLCACVSFHFSREMPRSDKYYTTCKSWQCIYIILFGVCFNIWYFSCFCFVFCLHVPGLVSWSEDNYYRLSILCVLYTNPWMSTLHRQYLKFICWLYNHHRQSEFWFINWLVVLRRHRTIDFIFDWVYYELSIMRRMGIALIS